MIFNTLVWIIAILLITVGAYWSLAVYILSKVDPKILKMEEGLWEKRLEEDPRSQDPETWKQQMHLADAQSNCDNRHKRMIMPCIILMSGLAIIAYKIFC